MPISAETAAGTRVAKRFQSTGGLRMRKAAIIIQGSQSSAGRAPDPSPDPSHARWGPAERARKSLAPLLELGAVSKTYGAVTALAGLTASIAPGEFVTVVGPSGCGKSTLFNIVAGLEEPDAGGILRFEGRSCHAADLLGRVSFMPQRDLLFPWRNVMDNAILALEVEGVPRAEARAKALKMLPEFGLAGFEKQYPNQLSGGMRQRVALMRTFLFERDLMLLDEPFGALDALTRAMMQRWLLDVWQKYRRTILFITHDVDEAIFLGDRVLRHDRPPRLREARAGRRSCRAPRRPDIVDRSRIHPPQAHAARRDRGGEHEIVPVHHRTGEGDVNAIVSEHSCPGPPRGGSIRPNGRRGQACRLLPHGGQARHGRPDLQSHLAARSRP